MTDILFISETEIRSELQLAQTEITHHGYTLSQPIRFDKAINLLRINEINMVLINAHNKKLEAYDLAREIKEIFRSAIKVIVYLPESNANEGSKFGLLNAEVEDQSSIKTIVNKLCPKKHRDYICQENISCIYSLNGGTGSSFITILLAYILNFHNQDSLILESSNSFSIRDSLNIESGLALLSRDRSKEINQARDMDWFQSFISNPTLIAKMSYLNLFNNIRERMHYLDQASVFATKLAEDLETFLKKDSDSHHLETIQNKLLGTTNSIKLLAKELEGDSFSLFDEVFNLGAKISKNIFVDISSDTSSLINKQLLRFSKNIVIVFKDLYQIKTNYLNHKQFFEEQYKLNVVPVLAPGYYNYNKYLNLAKPDWKEILGEIPLIYPYRPEAITRFIYEQEPMPETEKLFTFGKELLKQLNINANQEGYKSSRNILKLLVGANA